MILTDDEGTVVGISVESIHLVFFLQSAPQGDARHLWDVALSSNSMTSFQTVVPGSSQAKGVLSNASANFIITPSRVDLHLQALPSEGPQQDQFPTALSAPDEALAEGLNAMEALSAHLAVNRTACVFQGFHLGVDQNDTRRILKEELVPGLPLPENAREATFQYSVNTNSELNATRVIKQVAKWQMVRLQLINIQIGSMTPQFVQAPKETYAVHVSMDVFAETAENLDAKAAFASLWEVANLSNVLIKGGPHV